MESYVIGFHVSVARIEEEEEEKKHDEESFLTPPICWLPCGIFFQGAYLKQQAAIHV